MVNTSRTKTPQQQQQQQQQVQSNTLPPLSPLVSPLLGPSLSSSASSVTNSPLLGTPALHARPSVYANPHRRSATSSPLILASSRPLATGILVGGTASPMGPVGPTGPTGPTGVPAKRRKSDSHRLAEQGRRARLNSALRELESLLPAGVPETVVGGVGDGNNNSAGNNNSNFNNCSNTSISNNNSSNNSKAATVERACLYIKTLKQELETLRNGQRCRE